MRLSLCMFAVFFLSGCAVERAASSQRASAQPLAIPADPFAHWVDLKTIYSMTPDEIQAMGACSYVLKPESRQAMMLLLFDYYQGREGKPYLAEIAANWLSRYEVCICEAQWQYGDLNADGVVDMTDFAIYGNIEPR